MATYEPVNTTTNTYIHTGAHHSRNETITKVTDGNDSNLEFTVGESVTITLGSGSEVAGTYRGTITIDGVEYPVVQRNSNSNWYVLDTGGLDKVSDGGTAPNAIGTSNITAETFTVCFFPGTLIATPSGECKVEELVPGDPVVIGELDAVPATWIVRMGRKFRKRLGFAGSVPVKWLGRQTVSTRFGAAVRLMPVRFAAGSLGGGGGGPPPPPLFCRIAT